MSSVQDTVKCPQCGGATPLTSIAEPLRNSNSAIVAARRSLLLMFVTKMAMLSSMQTTNLSIRRNLTLVTDACVLPVKNGGATLYSMTEPLTDESAADILKSFNTELVDVGKSYLTKMG